MVLLALLVLLDHEVCRDFQAKMEKQEEMVNPEQQDQLGQLENVAYPACRECQDLKVTEDFQVLMEPKEKLVDLVKRVSLVVQVLMDQGGLQDLPDQEEKEAERVLQDPLA